MRRSMNSNAEDKQRCSTRCGNARAPVSQSFLVLSFSLECLRLFAVGETIEHGSRERGVEHRVRDLLGSGTFLDGALATGASKQNDAYSSSVRTIRRGVVNTITARAQEPTVLSGLVAHLVHKVHVGEFGVWNVAVSGDCEFG